MDPFQTAGVFILRNVKMRPLSGALIHDLLHTISQQDGHTDGFPTTGYLIF